ncbi:MAG: PEGA domain-containing protein [bacterium]
MLKRGFWVVQSLVSSILSLIWGLISLILRIAIVFVVIGSLLVGLSYFPAVRARVPIMKEVPNIAKQWLVYAGVNGSRWLVSLASAQKAEQPQKKPTPASVAASQPLTVKSTPPGAIVQLNARQVGKTPVTLKLAPGTYKLTISRSGYAPVTRTITVRAGKAASLNVTLVARRQTPRRIAPTPRSPSESPREP